MQALIKKSNIKRGRGRRRHSIFAKISEINSLSCCHIGFGSIILTNSSKVGNQAKKVLLTLHFLRLGAVSSVKDVACAFFPRTPFPLLFAKRLRYCSNRNFLCPTILPHTLCPKTQKYNLQFFQCLHRLYFAERWSCPVLHAKTRPRVAVGQFVALFKYIPLRRLNACQSWENSMPK